MAIEQMWTDGIEQAGVVRRVNYHCLVVFPDGSKQWHYFGSTPTEKPPTTDDPISEHAYVQFPQAFDDLPGDEGSDAIYSLGLRAGLHREGVEV